MSGLTPEQILADPLYRASHGLPPLKKTTYSEPRTVQFQIADYDLPLILDKPIPRPGEKPVPPADPFNVEPTKATSDDIAAMAAALKTPTK